MGVNQWLDKVVSETYEAALDGARWTSVLRLIESKFHGVSATYFVLDRRNHRIRHWSDRNIEQSGVKEYDAYYASIDPRIQYAEKYSCSGSTIYDYLHSSEESISSSEYYNWLSERDHRYYIAGITLHDPARLGVISVQRNANGGHVSETEIALFRELVPHFARATRISDKIGYVSLFENSMLQIIDQLPFAALLLDDLGKCVYVNQLGEAALSRHDGFRIRPDGKLQAADTLSDERLQHAVARAIRYSVDQTTRPPKEAVSIRRNTCRNAYIAFALPLIHRDGFGGLRTPTVLVLLRDPDHEFQVECDRIQSVFELTAAEARAVCALCGGQSQGAYARKTGLSIETVRSHVKRALEKTDTHKQAELVALILRTLSGLPK